VHFCSGASNSEKQFFQKSVFLFWGIQFWEAIFSKKCIFVLGHPNLGNCYSFIQSAKKFFADRSNLSQVEKYQFYKLSIKEFWDQYYKTDFAVIELP